MIRRALFAIRRDWLLWAICAIFLLAALAMYLISINTINRLAEPAATPTAYATPAAAATWAGKGELV